MMSMARTKTPLSSEETEDFVAMYNAYVKEWNAREGDPTRELPSDSDEWSMIQTYVDPSLHPNRHVCYFLKADPDRRIVLRTKKMTLYQTGTGLKNTISSDNIRDGGYVTSPAPPRESKQKRNGWVSSRRKYKYLDI